MREFNELSITEKKSKLHSMIHSEIYKKSLYVLGTLYKIRCRALKLNHKGGQTRGAMLQRQKKDV